MLLVVVVMCFRPRVRVMCWSCVTTCGNVRVHVVVPVRVHRLANDRTGADPRLHTPNDRSTQTQTEDTQITPAQQSSKAAHDRAASRSTVESSASQYCFVVLVCCLFVAVPVACVLVMPTSVMPRI